MPITPEERLSRLINRCRSFWDRVRHDPSQADIARAWLRQHPCGLPEVDLLWLRCLDGEGPLARWFHQGAEPASWTLDVPLHSVLTSHPFAPLPTWRIQPTSPGS